MRKVSNSYIDNMKTLLKDDLDKEDVNLDSVNEINTENNSHQNETEAVDEEESRFKEHDVQNSFEIIEDSYGDNMEFFITKNMYDEELQHHIKERELSKNLNNSLTMSTFDSSFLLEENEVDKEKYQQNDLNNGHVPEENEIYVLYVRQEDMNSVESPPATEEALAETKITPVHREEMLRESPYSYFDSFENEAFSSPRQRIAQHFNQIVLRPWQANYAWRR